MPTVVPVSSTELANGSAVTSTAQAEKTMIPADPALTLALGQPAELRRHAHEVRGLGRAVAIAAQVQDVQADQDDGVLPGQVPAQHDRAARRGRRPR